MSKLRRKSTKQKRAVLASQACSLLLILSNLARLKTSSQALSAFLVGCTSQIYLRSTDVSLQDLALQAGGRGLTSTRLHNLLKMP